MPTPLVFDDNKWKIGEPDLVVQMLPKDLEIPGSGPDMWRTFVTDTGLTEDRYIKAVEVKPIKGGRVIHHIGTSVVYPDGGGQAAIQSKFAITELMGDDSELDLPPNTDNVRTDSYLIMSKPTRLLTFTPHMHTRGKAMCLEVIYPEKSKKRDGSRVETLSCVNHFNFNWMLAYEYASDVQPLLPAVPFCISSAGTTIRHQFPPYNFLTRAENLA